MAIPDWSPQAYGRFRALRLRPALDLLAQVPADLPQGALVDLGCGSGAVGGALLARYPGRVLAGVDTSPAMLAEAEAAGHYRVLSATDAGDWRPEPPVLPVALIYSNAALHWLSGHEALFARLAGFLAPGGVLAVQMPRQIFAPSHRFLRDFAAEMFPDRFDFAAWRPPVAAPADLHRMLAPLGQVSVWETEYVQVLEPADEGHPVRRFTEATAMRPFLSRLSAEEAQAFTRRYDSALAAAYPPEADESALFPFRRVFLTLQV